MPGISKLRIGGVVAALMVFGSGVVAGSASDIPDGIVFETVQLDQHPSGDLVPNGRGCAVRLSANTVAPQDVITIGDGESESLNCYGLVEAGPLPSLPGSMGFIYEIESGPNSVFNVAVILSWDSASRTWIRNEAYSGVLTINADVATLQDLRDALEQ